MPSITSQWIERSDPRGDKIRRSKIKVVERIQEKTGLVLDQVNKAGEKGGTTTNGPQGRRFFSEETIDVIKELSDEKHKEWLVSLHRQLSIVLSVVSSTRKIDLTKFKRLCYETSLNISNHFPWVSVNHTLHGLIHHSTELISINDSYALGSLSDECLEAKN